MQIAVIGSGHVGLVTGLCFAEKGHQVLCVDHDQEKIAKLKEGQTNFYEAGLEALLHKHLQAGNVRFSCETAEAVEFGQALFICVSTPSNENGQVNMRYFEAVSRQIAEHLKDYRLIVEKSTVPVQTSEHVKKTIRRYAQQDVNFDVASNPEFLREGSAIQDTLEPSRIVIGVETPKARKLMEEIYDPFDAPKLVTSIHSAEMIKLASNAYLATRISFINAISRICELGGADIEEVAAGMRLDPRIGKSFLNAGIGYGGSCFPKDVDGLYQMAAGLGYDFELVKATQEINEAQWQQPIRRLEQELWSFEEKRVALWGMSFKPGTDDIRSAPSLKIARSLLLKGARVRACDPVAMPQVQRQLPTLEVCKSPLETAQDCDALILCTEWPEYLEVSPQELKEQMRVPLVYDGRNALDAEAFKEAGFLYMKIGVS